MESTAVSEEEVEAFLQALQNADVDKKVRLLQAWSARLEGVSELPEKAYDAITLLVAPLLRSTSHLLVVSVLASFSPSFLAIIPPASSAHSHLGLSLSRFLPPLVDKLGDPKDKVHDPARECIGILGRKVYQGEADAGTSSTLSSSTRGKEKDSLAGKWEGAVKDVFSGRSSRAKLGVLKLLMTMRNDRSTKLPLKPWLPGLVLLLEDSDGGVREQAKETVVALLSPKTVPAAARSELKKLMQARNVRSSIADPIYNRIFGPSATTQDSASSGRAETALSMRDPGPSRSSAPTPGGADIAVVYIANGRDLEAEFKTMLPHFQGKETEHNWGPREKALVRIRGMLRGQVFATQSEVFAAGLKNGLLEGITKTLMSLRTTVAQHACALVQELAEHLKGGFDPSVEHVLPVLGKMAGFTKKIIAERSQRAVSAIIKNTTAHPRVIIGHLAAASQDKSVSSRQYAVQHLKLFLDAQDTASVHHIESAAGVWPELEQLMKRSLCDTSPPVREQARASFWSFEKLWPDAGAAILDGLDATARRQLERANPGSGSGSGNGAAARPIAASARPTPPKTRVNSTRDAILAAKRAKAAELAAARAAEQDGNTSTPTKVSTPRDGFLLAQSLNTPSPAKTEPFKSVVASQQATWSERVPPAARGGGISSTREPETPVLQQRRPSSDAKRATHSDRKVSYDRERKSATPQSEKKPRTPLMSRPSQLPRPIPGSPGLSVAMRSSTSSNASSRSRSSSLARTLSHSPPSLMDSMHHSLRHPGVGPGTASASSDTSGANLRTPTQTRVHLPAVSRQLADTDDTSEFLESPPRSRRVSEAVAAAAAAATPAARRQSWVPESPPTADPAEEARRAQVAQGLSAAQQLLDFDDDQMDLPTQPMTPVRALKGGLHASPFRTPFNGGQASRSRHGWEDSPRAITPKLLQQLKGRGYERSWWQERQNLLDKAMPLEDGSEDTGIAEDVAGLLSGSPSLRNLQKITLFSRAHPITQDDGNGMDVDGGEGGSQSQNQRQVWEDNGLFGDIIKGLMALLDPNQPAEILEQGMVLLWELVQNQWPLFDGREDDLLDSVFRLRASSNPIILESTNSLVSLLTEVCNPPFLLLLLRSALERYVDAHGAALDSAATDGAADAYQVQLHGAKATTAGYILALNAMGMSILHLPREAVEAETKQLAPKVMTALEMTAAEARQAAYRVLLAVQCLLGDDVWTLSLFPGLDSSQRSFATYLMQQNGVMGKPGNDWSDDAARRQAVHSDLVNGLAKGARVL